jgi:hypothetical protein
LTLGANKSIIDSITAAIQEEKRCSRQAPLQDNVQDNRTFTSDQNSELLSNLLHNRLNPLTREFAYKTKKQLPPNMSISVKDKNTGQLRAECPKIVELRITNEIYKCPAFKLENDTYEEILGKIHNEYKISHVKQLGYWKPGKLPLDYTIPKQKDPIKKARLIASFFHHPLKVVYQNTSKILTWMFSTIQHRYGYFTLYKLSDISKRLRQAESILNKTFGTNTGVLTVQTDITKMYTYLNHDDIRNATLWLFKKAQKTYTANKRRTRTTPPYVIMSKTRNPDTNKKQILWSDIQGSDDYITAS